jgi:hypothetical protein
MPREALAAPVASLRGHRLEAALARLPGLAQAEAARIVIALDL